MRPSTLSCYAQRAWKGRVFEITIVYRNYTFDQVHVDGARAIAEACVENDVARFVHVSALNADENSTSGFLRSKALGEKAVREVIPETTIVRPGTMYGQEDRFLNRIGSKFCDSYMMHYFVQIHS